MKTADEIEPQAWKVMLDRLFRKYEPWVFWFLFGALLFIYLLPLALTSFLPFSDLPGHLGMVGAVLHRSVPEAAIHKYFWTHPHFGPNGLEYGITWALSHLVSTTAATRVFAGICVAALPLSVWYALEAFQKNRWLVFLAFPFAYPRIMWFGFMGSALGVSLLIVSVALARRTIETESFVHPILAAVVLWLSGLAHPFFFAASAGLLFLTLCCGLVASPFSWKKPLGFALYLPALILFYGWFAQLFGTKPGPAPKQSLWDHILSRRPKPGVYKQWLADWSLHAYKDITVEAAVRKTLLWTGLSFLALAVGTYAYRRWKRFSADRKEGKKPLTLLLEPLKSWRVWMPRGAILPLCLVSVLAAYYALPGSIQRPVTWWCVAQRLVTPLILFSILVIPGTLPGKLAPLFALPALIASTYYGVFLAHDFKTHFHEKEMKGLPAALSQIPPGQRVLALYDDREDHYAHFPLHFGAAYYVALRGGFALPFPVAPGYKKLVWAYPKKLTPGPPWGRIFFFNYRRHGRHYDYFLIKRHGTRNTRWNRFPRHCVKVRGHFGRWTVVQRLKKGGC